MKMGGEGRRFWKSDEDLKGKDADLFESPFHDIYQKVDKAALKKELNK